MKSRVVAMASAAMLTSAASAGAQIVSPTPAGVTAPAGGLTLSELERRALAGNPTIAQAAAEVEASRGRARQAGLLPNPTIGYTGEEISRGPIIRGGEHGAFVEQVVPLGGKLRLSREIFEREATQGEAVADVQRQRVLTDVRILYYMALAADRRISVRERLAALAAEAVAVSRQLFNTGAADAPDVLEAEIETRRAQLALESAQNARAQVWRRLGATVGDPALAPQPLAGTIEQPVPEVEREAMTRRVLDESPELEAARLAVERARAVLAREQKEPAPDLVLRGGPRYNRELLEANSQPVGWEAFADVGLVVPLFDRNPGGIAAARAEITRAEAEVMRVELALRHRMADAFDGYLSALRTVETYRADVLPRAEEAYRQYFTRYREMAAAYPQVLVAQRTLFQVTDQYVDAAEAAWKAALGLQGYLLTGGLEAPPSGHR